MSAWGCSSTPAPSPDAATADAAVDATIADTGDATATDGATTDAPIARDAGACGRAGARTGQWYEEITSRSEARRMYVSVPAGYDPSRAYPVVFGLHGRDYDGIRMRDYLALESQTPNDWAIFVYPDALRRMWSPTFSAVGWQNGPVASMTSDYGGTDDLAFIDDAVAWVRAHYCVDDARIFATGQSWGGDFSNVVGCFRGETFRAVAPVAANGDYYLPVRADAAAPCVGHPAVWAFHGVADPSFTLSLGERYRDFWVRRNGCDATRATALRITDAMSDDACVEYPGCGQPTRWCAYNAASGHQVPRAYYAREVVAFFRGF